MGTIKKEGNKIYVQSKNEMKLMGEVQSAPAGKAKVLEMFRNREKHLFRVWNSYGFSKEVVDHKDWFDYILLSEKHGDFITEYMIPREDVGLHGKQYESDGYERQYFLTLKQLEEYMI